MYLVEGSLWIFGNSHISNNSASQDGGAMSILDSQFVMSGTALFANNLAKIGGAINIITLHENTATAFFNGSHVVFVNNSASTGGGGIACSDSELRAEHLLFTHNTAGEGGGGIGALNCRVQLTDISKLHEQLS